MRLAALVLMFVALGAPRVAEAQTPSPAAQALSACIEQHTTSEDNIVLLRWLFVSIARHPSVSPLAAIPDAERVDANRQMGALFNRLVLESCSSETRAAFQSDGQPALNLAFEEFGERAMTSLMSNPDVGAGMSEVGAYIDEQRLQQLMPPSR